VTPECLLSRPAGPTTRNDEGGQIVTPNSLEALDRIVDVDDRFESEWRRGLRPRIEAFLDEPPPACRAELLQELLRIELQLRREKGEYPRATEYAGGSRSIVSGSMRRSRTDWTSPDRALPMSLRQASRRCRPSPATGSSDFWALEVSARCGWPRTRTSSIARWP
jgi:hypothetical protein